MTGGVTGSSARGTVTVHAVVFPGCVCGRPWPEHKGTASCGGYQPAGEIKDLGLRSYQHRSRLCMLLWAIEVRLQGIRERRERAWKEREDGF